MGCSIFRSGLPLPTHCIISSIFALGNSTWKVSIVYSSTAKLPMWSFVITREICGIVFTGCSIYYSGLPLPAHCIISSLSALGNSTWKVRIVYFTTAKLPLWSFAITREICGIVFTGCSIYYSGLPLPAHCIISCLFALGSTTWKVRIVYSSTAKLLLWSFASTHEIFGTVIILQNPYFRGVPFLAHYNISCGFLWDNTMRKISSQHLTWV